jgi:hypothetical protein
MSVQFSVTVRNAMLDVIQTNVGTSAKLMFFSGAVPANCAAPTTGTKLLEFDLASNWGNNASGGAKSVSGLPLSVAALAAGALGYFSASSRPIAPPVTCKARSARRAGVGTSRSTT